MMTQSEGDVVGWQPNEFSLEEVALAQQQKSRVISETLHYELRQTLLIFCPAIIVLIGCIALWITPYTSDIARNLILSIGMISLFVAYSLGADLIALYRWEREAQKLQGLRSLARR